MIKVSFDFDGTLEFEDVQRYAAKLLQKGIEVWVVTTRWDENHKHKYPLNSTLDDLWEVVDRLGIPRHRVRFTCMEWKATYLKGTHFVWHLDDNDQEVTAAKKTEGCNVPIIDVLGNDWEEKCDRLLRVRLNEVEANKTEDETYRN
jgi:hypothetical protein